VSKLVALTRSAALAWLLLCASATVPSAEQGGPPAVLQSRSHLQCRIYFGCLPDLALERRHVRQN